MKLLVNKNCSGYHWFGCDLTGDEQYIKMYEEQSVNQVSSFLGGLRIYGQFEYCLIRDKGTYLLAINNINEKERDVFGRPISIKMIFIGDKEHAQLLLKILLTALEDFNSFSDKMNSCFASSSMSCPIYVRCDWQKLHSFIQEVESKVLTSDTKKILADSSMRLIAVSNESVAMGKNGLGFSDKEIHNAKDTLKSMQTYQYFEPASACRNNTQFGLDIEAVTETEIVPTPKTSTNNGNHEYTDSEFRPDSSVKGTVIENSNGIIGEVEELRNKLYLLKEKSSHLQHQLDAAKLESKQLKEIYNRKNHLYNGLLAASGAVIITLLILYILK